LGCYRSDEGKTDSDTHVANPEACSPDVRGAARIEPTQLENEAQDFEESLNIPHYNIKYNVRAYSNPSI
jgi:hypothetical protein